MSPVAEQVRGQLEALLQEVDASVDERLAAMELQCAMAMEQAHLQASIQLEADRAGLIEQGREEERQRLLMAIELQLETLREGGANSLALHSLRRLVRGEGADA